MCVCMCAIISSSCDSFHNNNNLTKEAYTLFIHPPTNLFFFLFFSFFFYFYLFLSFSIFFSFFSLFFISSCFFRPNQGKCCLFLYSFFIYSWLKDQTKTRRQLTSIKALVCLPNPILLLSLRSSCRSLASWPPALKELRILVHGFRG